MELRYVGRFSAVIFDAYGLVRRGDIIELPDEIAEQKLKRDPNEWEKVGKKKKVAEKIELEDGEEA